MEGAARIDGHVCVVVDVDRDLRSEDASDGEVVEHGERGEKRIEPVDLVCPELLLPERPELERELDAEDALEDDEFIRGDIVKDVRGSESNCKQDSRKM